MRSDAVAEERGLIEISRGYRPEVSELKSAKRSGNERCGVHAWHPYYAGYSESFVDSALKYLDCDRGMTILDPWGGSGTTSLVASRLGLQSISVDINPAISALSASKSFEVVKHAHGLSAFCRTLNAQFSSKNLNRSPHQANEWLQEIVCAASTSFPRLSLTHQSAASHLCLNANTVPLSYPLRAFLQVAAFRLGRLSEDGEALSNPTWVKYKDENKKSTLNATIDFKSICHEMLAELKNSYQGNVGAHSFHLIGDSRKLPISTGVIDRIVTSPPYLTRIDYAVAAAPELALLKVPRSLRDIRLDTMGSPVIRGPRVAQNPSWGEKCNKFLNEVASHESKAAKSYYWKHMLQYFEDMERSLSEIRRVLRRGGRALVVVQGSYFKEILCPLGELYEEMAEGVGLKAEIVFNDRVASHMAHLNMRSSKYLANKVYSEDFVLLTKR